MLLWNKWWCWQKCLHVAKILSQMLLLWSRKPTDIYHLPFLQVLSVDKAEHFSQFSLPLELLFSTRETSINQSINQDFEWTFQIYLTRDLQSVYGYHTVHNYVLITQAKEEFSWVLIVLHLLNFLYRNNGSVASVFVAKLVVFEIHMVNGLVLLNTLILEMQLV